MNVHSWFSGNIVVDIYPESHGVTNPFESESDHTLIYVWNRRYAWATLNPTWIVRPWCVSVATPIRGGLAVAKEPNTHQPECSRLEQLL